MSLIWRIEKVEDKQEAEKPKEDSKASTPEEKSAPANLGIAMSSLGLLQVQLVTIMQELDKAKATIEAHKKAEEEKAKASKDGAKSVDELKDTVKFYRQVIAKRPRLANADPMAMPQFQKRILCYHDWSRKEMSILACVSKPWRKYCQGILFARLKSIYISDKHGCDEMTKYLEKKKHLAEYVETIDISFKSHYGHVDTGIADYVPVSVLKLLELCKGLEKLSLSDMAAFIATPKVMKAVSTRVTSISIDPHSYSTYGKAIEFSNRPSGLFADWKKLEHITVTRCQFLIFEKTKAACPLASFSLNQCLVSGSLSLLFSKAKDTLKSLELIAVTGIVCDDLMMVLDEFGPRLIKLALRSCRFLSDISQRSFDNIFAKCVNLEHLLSKIVDLSRVSSYGGSNVDLEELPILTPATFLAQQIKLVSLELKKAEWIGKEDWLNLFGCPSRSIKTLTIVSPSYWHPSEVDKMKEAWRWKNVGSVNFVRARVD